MPGSSLRRIDTLNPLVKTILAQIKGREFRKVSPRGIETLETLGLILRVENSLVTEENLKEAFPAFSSYMAKARAECIKSTVSLEPVISRLDEDPMTRRAFIYTYDWAWSNHPECILGVQFIIREDSLYTFGFLRASDLGRALAYDLYALNDAANTVALEVSKSSKINIEPKEIVLLISSAHIYPNDPETPDWLRGEILER